MPTPTRFRARERERIIELLGAGASRARAARAVGVAPSTLSRWIERGRISDPQGRWAEFRRRVLEAEADPVRLRAVRDEPAQMVADAAGRFLERAGEFGSPADPVEIVVTFAPPVVITRPEKEEPP